MILLYLMRNAYYFRRWEGIDAGSGPGIFTFSQHCPRNSGLPASLLVGSWKVPWLPACWPARPSCVCWQRDHRCSPCFSSTLCKSWAAPDPPSPNSSQSSHIPGLPPACPSGLSKAVSVPDISAAHILVQLTTPVSTPDSVVILQEDLREELWSLVTRSTLRLSSFSAGHLQTSSSMAITARTLFSFAHLE